MQSSGSFFSLVLHFLAQVPVRWRLGVQNRCCGLRVQMQRETLQTVPVPAIPLRIVHHPTAALCLARRTKHFLAAVREQQTMML
jgi:hypothetical protein